MFSIPKDIFVNHIFSEFKYIEIEKLKFVSKEFKEIVDFFNKNRKRQSFEAIVKLKDYYSFQEYTKIHDCRCLSKYGDIYMINRFLKYNIVDKSFVIGLCMRKEFHYISNYFLFQEEIFSFLTKLIFKGLTLTDKGELILSQILKSGNLELIEKLNKAPYHILHRTNKSMMTIMKYCIESSNIQLVDFVYYKFKTYSWGISEYLAESTQNIKIFNYFMKQGAYISDKVFITHCLKEIPEGKLENCLKMADYLLDCYPEHCRIKDVLQILSKDSPIYNHLSKYCQI